MRKRFAAFAGTVRRIVRRPHVHSWSFNKGRCMDCGAPMLNTWQHEETGRLCELPDGQNPGSRWFLVKMPN